MIIMLGVTPYRDMRYSAAHKEANVSKGAVVVVAGIGALHSSTALSKPSCSFWAMAYIITSATAAILRINGKAMEA